MVSDMHSFAALQCRTGKKAAGRSAKLLGRHQSHRCHHHSAPKPPEPPTSPHPKATMPPPDPRHIIPQTPPLYQLQPQPAPAPPPQQQQLPHVGMFHPQILGHCQPTRTHCCRPKPHISRNILQMSSCFSLLHVCVQDPCALTQFRSV